MDWTEDAGLHQWFKDLKEEVELILDMVLSHIRSQETKLKFVSIWAGKEARICFNKGKKDSLKTMLDTLDDWTKPKSYKIATFMQIRALNQSNKTISTCIQEVGRMVDL